MDKITKKEQPQIEQPQKTAKPLDSEKAGTLTGKSGNRSIVITKLEEFKNIIGQQLSNAIRKIDQDFNEKFQELNKKISKLQNDINASTIALGAKEKLGRPIETGLRLIQVKFEKEIQSITDLIQKTDQAINEDVQTFNKKVKEYQKEINGLQDIFREMMKGTSNKDNTTDNKKE